MAWGDGRRFDARRTAWQLMFAAGDVEMIWTWDPKERDHVLQPTEMTSAWLERMKSNFDGQRAHMGRLGASPQPYPVSLQHAIEERIFYGWTPWAMEGAKGLRWLGSIYQLAYHSGGTATAGGVDVDLPAGLYALVEWTPEAMEDIRDGKWVQLSPTTVSDWRMTDGTVFEGDSLFAAALVDYGKLDSIGTLRDCLPYDTFELGDSEPHELAEDETPMLSFRSLRSALRRSGEPSPGEATWAAPQLRSSGPAILRRGTVRKAFARGTNRPESGTTETPPADPSSNERAMKTEQTPTTATETTPAPAATQRAAEPDATPSAPKAVDPAPTPEPAATTQRASEPSESPKDPIAELRAAEEARFGEDCRKLCEERRLLVRDVPEVLTRMRQGKPYDDLLGDYGVPTARAGHQSDDTDPSGPAKADNSAPVESRANTATFTEAELVEWASRSSESQGKTAYALFEAREREIIAAGGTITRDDD